jgi:hypothetical protein
MTLIHGIRLDVGCSRRNGRRTGTLANANFRWCSVVEGIDLVRRALVLPLYLHSDTPVAVVVAKFMGTSVLVANLQPDHPNPTTTQFTLFGGGERRSAGSAVAAK